MTRRRPLLAALALLGVVALLLPASAARAADPWGFDPRFDAGDADDVLVKAEPPLKRGDLEHFEDLLEAAFDMAVPPLIGQRLRDALEEAWPKAKPEKRKAFLALSEPWERLRGHGHVGEREVVDEGLMLFRRALDAWASGEKKEGAPETIVQALLASRLKKAWPGKPPIHELAAESWLELVDFLVSLGRNEDVKLTEGRRSIVHRDLGKALLTKDEATRQQILTAHRPWLRLQEAWTRAGAKERLMLRFLALETLTKAMPKGKRITLGAKSDLVGYARSATLLRGLQSAYDAYANLAHHPDLVLGVVEGWLQREGVSKNARPLLR